MSKGKRQFAEMAEPVLDKIQQGLARPECRICGCLHNAIETFEKALNDIPGAEAGELRDRMRTEEARLGTEDYDCLGCETCLGAEAVVLCAELFGGGAFDAAGALCQSPSAPDAAPGCG